MPKDELNIDFSKLNSAFNKVDGISTDNSKKDQLDLFTDLNKVFTKVDTKTVIDKDPPPQGVDIELLLDPHYTEDRHKIEERICMSCNNWIKPGCCELMVDYSYGMTSYRITEWCHTCPKWTRIHRPTFPAKKTAKHKRKNSYTEYKHKR